jgi:hypothetical protein
MKYQPLPDLTEAEYAALKAHIAAWVVQVPVVRDEHGNTLDGHRERAAKELGIRNYPVRTLSGLTEEQKRHYVLGVNVQRRHLTGRQKRALIASELCQAPDISDNWLAAIVGVDRKTVKTVRRRLKARREIPKVKVFRGKDGKKYRFTTVPTESAAHARQAGKALRTLGEHHPGRVIRVGKAARLARYLGYEESRNGHAGPDTGSNNIKLVCCDFRSLDVRAVDLIFTDPVWSDTDIWQELGRWACAPLWPGGVLAAYTGVAGLPAALAGLGQYLRYHWTACLFYSSEKVLLAKRRIKQGWCPLVIFTKGPWRRPNYFIDHPDGTQWVGGQSGDDLGQMPLQEFACLLVVAACADQEFLQGPHGGASLQGDRLDGLAGQVGEQTPALGVRWAAVRFWRKQPR